MRVAGIGCRAGAPPDALRDALAQAEAQGGATDLVATIASRLPQVDALGRKLIAAQVAGIDTPTKSPRVMALHGTGSVAEAAALAACGPGGRLTVRRVTSTCGRATAAIAEVKEQE